VKSKFPYVLLCSAKSLAFPDEANESPQAESAGSHIDVLRVGRITEIPGRRGGFRMREKEDLCD
jgi:hypothetical protein